MNRLTLKRKVMLFWYQNTDKIKEQVNSCHSSTEIIDKELILIVSIDLSKLLGANSTPIHHQMDEFSAIQKCPSLYYLNLDKLHPTQISSGNESEISSLESGYNDHINTNTSANSLGHQDYISEIGIGDKLTSYGSWTQKADQTKHFFSILKSGIVLNRKLGVTNWFLIGHILLTRNSRVYSLTVSSNFYITELIAILNLGIVLL